MQKKAPLTEETYIRHLPYSAITKLATSLDIDNLWERLAIKIPAKPDLLFTEYDANVQCRYTMHHIARFQDKSRQRGGSSTKALLTDWGTQNCKIKHLIEALRQAELVAAADYIQKELLHNKAQAKLEPGGSAPEGYSELCHDVISALNSSNINSDSSGSRVNELITEQLRVPPTTGGRLSDNRVIEMLSQMAPPVTAYGEVGSDRASQITMDDRVSHISDGRKSVGLGDAGPKSPSSPTPPTPPTQQVLFEDLEQTSNELISSIETLDQLKEIRYDILQAITNNFDKKKHKDGGNLIGEGGFGTVFVGTFSTGFQVAVKCLKENIDDPDQQFKTEIQTLTKFKHENLVYLLGYSSDEGRPHCLVYQYMPNGSLEERLACVDGTPPLSNPMRVEIAKGTAKGIAFLHTEGLIHRDIKSANILLDAEFNPKVGDFATARVLPAGMTTKIKASVLIGTAAYLAPEAYSFVIRPSLDVFSFGVVLLEILTGLPVIDQHREDADLRIHVQEHCGGGDDDGDDDDDDDDDEEPGTIFDLLDKKGGEWQKEVVDVLYSLSCECLKLEMRKRPHMKDVLVKLDAVYKNVNGEEN